MAQSVYELFLKHVQDRPGGVAIRHKHAGAWKDMAWGELSTGSKTPPTMIVTVAHGTAALSGDARPSAGESVGDGDKGCCWCC